MEDKRLAELALVILTRIIATTELVAAGEGNAEEEEEGKMSLLKNMGHHDRGK